jgi:ABC-type transporter Mla subunit MlaD
MQQASREQDGTRISQLSQSIHASQSAIDKLFDELEKTTDEFNTQSAVFDQELRELDENR